MGLPEQPAGKTLPVPNSAERPTMPPGQLATAAGDSCGRLARTSGSTLLDEPVREPVAEVGAGVEVEAVRWKRVLNGWPLAIASAASALGFAIYIAVATWQTDLLVYLMGGRLARTPALYTTFLPNRHLLFTYTPFAALLFAPFGQLGVSPNTAVAAQAVWTAFNMVALVGLLVLSIRVVRPEVQVATRWRLALLLTAPAVFLNPVLGTITYAQVNLMLALLVLWDLLGSRRIGSRTLPQGVATGLAVAIKLTPAIFIPFMLLTGRRRAAVNCMITFGVSIGIGFALSPGASWAYWTKDVFQPSRVGGLLYLGDQNLSSAIQRFDHGVIRGGHLLPVVLAIGIVGLVLAMWAHRRSSPVLGVIVCATTGLIVSPVTWAHHLVWVVPAIIWFAAAPDRPRRGVKIAAAVAVLFWSCPIWWAPRDALHELQLRGWQLVAGNSFLLAMLAFLAGILALLIRREWTDWRRRGAFVRAAAAAASVRDRGRRAERRASTPSVP